MPIDRHSRAYKTRRDLFKRRWAAEQRRCYLEGCELNFSPEARGQDNAVELDHILPVARGGSVMDPNNWAPACRKHNREKSDMTLAEYRAKRAVMGESTSTTSSTRKGRSTRTSNSASEFPKIIPTTSW